MVSSSVKNNREGGFQVGDSVSLRLGGKNVEGLVVEDRGALAAGGKHLYRVLVSFPEDELVAFEMPQYELALHAARRALLAEVTRRVVDRWWHMPLGGPVDRLTGFQALAQAVFESCRDVAKDVRTEFGRLVEALNRDKKPFASEGSDAAAMAQNAAQSVSGHAREHGSQGLHERIESSLLESAHRERDRLVAIAESLGWHDLAETATHPGKLLESWPLLALLADPKRSAQANGEASGVR